MSDIFDHALDAYESEMSWYMNGEGPEPDYRNGFSRDPNYYHIKVEYHEIVAQTEKAICLQFRADWPIAWFPKKLCRKLNEKDRTVLIWGQFLKQKCKEIQQDARTLQ